MNGRYEAAISTAGTTAILAITTHPSAKLTSIDPITDVDRKA
jgi:hypothetical protein